MLAQQPFSYTLQAEAQVTFHNQKETFYKPPIILSLEGMIEKLMPFKSSIVIGWGGHWRVSPIVRPSFA